MISPFPFNLVSVKANNANFPFLKTSTISSLFANPLSLLHLIYTQPIYTVWLGLSFLAEAKWGAHRVKKNRVWAPNPTSPDHRIFNLHVSHGESVICSVPSSQGIRERMKHELFLLFLPDLRMIGPFLLFLLMESLN